jgi:hypothetical protein
MSSFLSLATSVLRKPHAAVRTRRLERKRAGRGNERTARGLLRRQPVTAWAASRAVLLARLVHRRRHHGLSRQSSPVLTHPAFAPRTEKMAGRISAGRVVQLGWLLGALADAFSPAPLVVAPVAARLRFAACSQRVSLRHQLTLAAQQPLWDSVSVSVPASASDLPGTSIRRKIWVTDNPGNLNNLHQVPPSPAQGRKARPRRGTLTPGVRACAATRKRKRCRPRGPAR